MQEVDYTLDAEDVVSARLLAVGVRPRVEFALFSVTLAGLLAWSVSPWTIELAPLLIGLTASLAGFRLIQIHKIRDAAQAAYLRNPTLRRFTEAVWDEAGVRIAPASSAVERIEWNELARFRENERILVMLQRSGSLHAIPKRAFKDKAALAAFRGLARRQAGMMRR